MDRGRIIFDGAPLEVVEIYRTSVKKIKEKVIRRSREHG